MDINKAALAFSMQEPFYGIILSSMDKVEYPKIDTLAVAKTGNVFKLFYNKDFTDKLGLDELIECLKHEVLHLCFHHFSIWEDPEGVIPSEDERNLRNYACDLEVNCYVNPSKFHITHPILCKDFGLDERLGAREYYRILKQMTQPQQQNAQNPSQPCNGGQGGQQQNQNSQSQSGNQNQQGQNSNNQNQNQNSNQGGNPSPNTQGTPGQQQSGSGNNSGNSISDLMNSHQPFDDHSLWPNLSKEETEIIDQSIDELVAFAAEETEKTCGKLPGEMVGRLEQIKKKPRPVCDWKRYLRRYLGNEYTEEIRKSKKRESRRFPDAAGNRFKKKSHILVGIDTSGSVSMPEFIEFFGQLRILRDRATFHVVECDSKIQHEYDYTYRENRELHGGGGTSFEPVINKYLEERNKYDALVYFTDGEAYIPGNTPKDTLWVISSKGDQKDRKRYQVNGAKVVFIPKKQQ